MTAMGPKRNDLSLGVSWRWSCWAVRLDGCGCETKEGPRMVSKVLKPRRREDGAPGTEMGEAEWGGHEEGVVWGRVRHPRRTVEDMVSHRG